MVFTDLSEQPKWYCGPNDMLDCWLCQLSPTEACPNSAGLHFYALGLWVSVTTVSRTLLMAYTSYPLAVAGANVSMVILTSGIRHVGGGSLGWSSWLQLTKLLPMERSFANHMGTGIMLFSRFISFSLLDRVLFDKVLMACIIHSFVFFPRMYRKQRKVLLVGVSGRIISSVIRLTMSYTRGLSLVYWCLGNNKPVFDILKHCEFWLVYHRFP